MDEFALLIGGFGLVLFWLAWREHAVANRRDAGLLAGCAVVVGLCSVTSAVL